MNVSVKRIVRWFQGHNLWYSVSIGDDGESAYGVPCFRVRPFVAWYDAWVGVYVDRKARQVYVFPLPCIGFQVGYQYPSNDQVDAPSGARSAE